MKALVTVDPTVHIRDEKDNPQKVTVALECQNLPMVRRVATVQP